MALPLPQQPHMCAFANWQWLRASHGGGAFGAAPQLLGPCRVGCMGGSGSGLHREWVCGGATLSKGNWGAVWPELRRGPCRGSVVESPSAFAGAWWSVPCRVARPACAGRVGRRPLPRRTKRGGVGRLGRAPCSPPAQFAGCARAAIHGAAVPVNLGAYPTGSVQVSNVLGLQWLLPR